MSKRDSSWWVLYVGLTIVVACITLAILFATGALGNDDPTCPAGQAYRYTHTLIVGRVQIPQYACVEVS